MKHILRPCIASQVLWLSSCSLTDTMHLAQVAINDTRPNLPQARAGYGDVSRLHAPGRPGEVLEVPSDPAAAETALRAFLAEARQQHVAVSIAGARHSMGGQTMGQPGHFVIDMLPLNHISSVSQDPANPARHIVTVGAGARWKDIIKSLKKQGFAPKVMQSNSDFTVGGSLSVNCHGWQHNSPPIASTVRSIRVMTADGATHTCDRTHNNLLFSSALGGYGLVAIILEATLEVVPDARYLAVERRVPPADYVRTFKEMTRGSADGMAYGRISVAGDSFLTESLVTVLQPTDRPPSKTLLPKAVTNSLKRLVFRATVGSERGRNLRWSLEKRYGETAGLVQHRSEILSEPVALFGNRNPRGTDILHEYFIPGDRLATFIEDMRAIHLQGDCPDLLNITVRNVKTDPDTLLRYAREEVFGLVMLFHQRRDSPEAEEQMRRYTQRMISAALANRGAYYLPYRLHATPRQFQRAYPDAAAFVRAKRRFDPEGLFQNRLCQTYLITR